MDENHDRLRTHLEEEAKKRFRPEFLNRIDELIVFHQLSRANLHKIVELEIEKVRDRLKSRSLELTSGKDVRDFLIDKGFNPEYGARPIRRLIERHIEDSLAEKILAGEIHDGSHVEVVPQDGKLTFITAPAADPEEEVSTESTQPLLN